MHLLFPRRSTIAIACFSFLLHAVSAAQNTPTARATRFVLDGNRMYAELALLRPDGSIHRTLAFVDMGSPAMTLTESLFKELQLDRGRPLTLLVGKMAVELPAAEVDSYPSPPYSVGSPLKVEAVLAAGVLEKFQVVMDYRARTLTMAHAGNLKPQGIRVPFHIKKETGLIAVDAVIAGKSYSVTIDNGSAYSWFRQSVVKSWLDSNPQWQRGIGAVGASNMMMSGDGAEAAGIMARIPEIGMGSLSLQQVGVLGAGPGKGASANLSLFDWYSTKNSVPVIGWIGGNVLKNVRLTIDYPHREIYWLKQSAPETAELNQVGLTLQSKNGDYIVDAVAQKNGKPTVEGILPGDKLIRVGRLETKNASWGAIYQALHGRPGEARNLVLERNREQLAVAAKVTEF